MALNYKGTTYRSIEEQVKQNMQDISELQNEVGAIQPTGTIEIAGTSGTLTADQLSTLQSNSEYTITNNGTIFRQTENQPNSGYLIYSSTNQSGQTEILSITLSVGSWIINTIAEKKLYIRIGYFETDLNGAVNFMNFTSEINGTIKEGQVLMGWYTGYLNGLDSYVAGTFVIKVDSDNYIILNGVLGSSRTNNTCITYYNEYLTYKNIYYRETIEV